MNTMNLTRNLLLKSVGRTELRDSWGLWVFCFYKMLVTMPSTPITPVGRDDRTFERACVRVCVGECSVGGQSKNLPPTTKNVTKASLCDGNHMNEPGHHIIVTISAAHTIAAAPCWQSPRKTIKAT